MGVSRRDLLLAAGAAQLQSRMGAANHRSRIAREGGIPRREGRNLSQQCALASDRNWRNPGGSAISRIQGRRRRRRSRLCRRVAEPGQSSVCQTDSWSAVRDQFRAQHNSWREPIATGLDLPRSGGNIVTDALHFEGSLYQYGELAKSGLEVRIVRPREWRIELGDLDKVIDSKTKLVAVSLVSMINGFQHDLKAVCDLAHARGAMVYGDAVQAAGAVPVDVRASGVDFLACSSYKWLMGDMGLGFLYVREDRLDRIQRSQYGSRQLAQMQYHVFPYDPPGETVMDWKQAGGEEHGRKPTHFDSDRFQRQGVRE